MDEPLRYGSLGTVDRDAHGSWHFQRTLPDESGSIAPDVLAPDLVAAGQPERFLLLDHDSRPSTAESGPPGVLTLQQFHRDHPSIVVDDDLLLEHLSEDFELKKEEEAKQHDLDSMICEGQSRNSEQRTYERCIAVVLGTMPSVVHIVLARRHMDLAFLKEAQHVAYFEDLLPSTVFRKDVHARIKQIAFPSNAGQNFLLVLSEQALQVFRLLHEPKNGEANFSLEEVIVQADSPMPLPTHITAIAISNDLTVALLLTDAQIQTWQIEKAKRWSHVLTHRSTCDTEIGPGMNRRLFWSKCTPSMLIVVADNEIHLVNTRTSSVNSATVCGPGERIWLADLKPSDSATCDLLFVVTTTTLRVLRIASEITHVVSWAHYRPPESRLGLAVCSFGDHHRCLLWCIIDGWCSIYTMHYSSTSYTTLAPYAVDLQLEVAPSNLVILPFRMVHTIKTAGYFQILVVTRDSGMSSVVLATRPDLQFKRRKVMLKQTKGEVDVADEVGDEESDEQEFFDSAPVVTAHRELSGVYQHLLTTEVSAIADSPILQTAYEVLITQLKDATVAEIDDALESLVQSHVDATQFSASLDSVVQYLTDGRASEDAESTNALAFLHELQQTWAPERLRRRDASDARAKVIALASRNLCASSVVVGKVPLKAGQLDSTLFIKGRKIAKQARSEPVVKALLDDWQVDEPPREYRWRDLNISRSLEQPEQKRTARHRGRFDVDAIPAFRGSPAAFAAPPPVLRSTPVRPPALLVPGSTQPAERSLRAQLFKPTDSQREVGVSTQEPARFDFSQASTVASSQVESPFAMTQTVAGPHGSRAPGSKKKKKKRAGF